MKIIKATDARNNLYRLIDEASESHEPIHISGKRSNAVLISEEDWRSIQETLNLLSIPGMRESIIECLQTPVEECSEEPEWWLVLGGWFLPDKPKRTQREFPKQVLEIIRENPFKTSPPFEKLVGDLSGAYSRRINIQHRLVYQVLEDIKTVKIIRMWTHYEWIYFHIILRELKHIVFLYKFYTTYSPPTVVTDDSQIKLVPEWIYWVDFDDKRERGSI